MSAAVKFFSVFLLFAFFSHANAYYLENALPGTVTFSVAGALSLLSQPMLITPISTQMSMY